MFGGDGHKVQAGGLQRGRAVWQAPAVQRGLCTQPGSGNGLFASLILVCYVYILYEFFGIT